MFFLRYVSSPFTLHFIWLTSSSPLCFCVFCYCCGRNRCERCYEDDGDFCVLHMMEMWWWFFQFCYNLFIIFCYPFSYELSSSANLKVMDDSGRMLEIITGLMMKVWLRLERVFWISEKLKVKWLIAGSEKNGGWEDAAAEWERKSRKEDEDWWASEILPLEYEAWDYVI